MRHTQSFDSMSVEVGGTSGVWDLPTEDDPTLDSLPPPNLPSSPPPLGIEIPLSIPQLFHKYYKQCMYSIGVDTAIALICFVISCPYMLWAAYAGNYASLAKGIHTYPAWMSRLEQTDTVIIGAFGAITTAILLYLLFEHPVVKKVLFVVLGVTALGVGVISPVLFVTENPSLYFGLFYSLALVTTIAPTVFLRKRLKQPKLPLYIGVPMFLVVIIHFIMDYTLIRAFVQSSQREFRLLVRVFLTPIFFRAIISFARPLSRRITGVKGEHFQIFVIMIHSFNRAAFGRLFTYELDDVWYVAGVSLATAAADIIVRIVMWNRDKILSLCMNTTRVFPSPPSPPPSKFMDAFIIEGDSGDEYYAVFLHVERFMETACILSLGFLKLLSVVAFTNPVDIGRLALTGKLFAIQLVIETFYQVFTMCMEIYFDLPIFNFLRIWKKICTMCYSHLFLWEPNDIVEEFVPYVREIPGLILRHK